MKLFFYAPETSSPRLRDGYATITRLLRHAGHDVIAYPGPAPAGTGDATGTLDHVGAFVVEGSTPSPEVGYFLAQGLAQKKPTLYLYHRGSGGDQLVGFLRRKPDPYTLIVRPYRDTDLGKEVHEFLEYLAGGAVREAPSLKFTLRITPSLEKYLEYRARVAQQSKADFLREHLEQLMKDDAAYLRSLRRSIPDDPA